MRLTKKGLEKIVEGIPPPSKPKIRYEQHTTPSWIAADFIWKLYFSGKVLNKTVIDMGAGTGRLSIPLILLGAREAVALDVDEDVVMELMSNAKVFNIMDKIHIVLCDATYSPLRKTGSSIIIMNPPFGTVIKGLDTKFLLEAMRLSDEIYSFHLSSEKTRKYLSMKAGEKGYNLRVINTYYMELKQIFEYHVSRLRRVRVDLIYYSRR